ncbi:PREDICTED: LIM and senescent cell antigen-like-containing domain protein 2 isoform X3 [Propithecus coquereli]|uniref:LIM and senescent cell antigen-like-containing domain protein 2 isoform X3 n=1 Tax=Propithecus coquereli TaxID=379532 RepID=UPI00063F1C23|nr:PREDICTED: LIM and senescent cell antigen-like-containing domain protein 2 isoform X3 [Propithecus coquereli]
MTGSNMSDALANAVCQRCQARFAPAERIVHSSGELYHEHCFVCAQCFRPFPEGLFYEFEGRKYCEHDFQMLFAPCCGSCGEFIIGRVIKAMNNNWHPGCFRCELCDVELADLGFVKNAGSCPCAISTWHPLASHNELRISSPLRTKSAPPCISHVSERQHPLQRPLATRPGTRSPVWHSVPSWSSSSALRPRCRGVRHSADKHVARIQAGAMGAGGAVQGPRGSSGNCADRQGHGPGMCQQRVQSPSQAEAGTRLLPLRLAGGVRKRPEVRWKVKADTKVFLSDGQGSSWSE